MKILIDIPDNKVDLALKFFKSISFIKNARPVEKNKITNPVILKSIEDYESGKVNPSILNLADLKKIINA
jgi:CRISPR/Cas system-associated protein Csx1